MGEAAFSSWSGIPWNQTIGQPDSGCDVGIYGVRTGQRPDHGLILHTKDQDATPFVLAVPLVVGEFRRIGLVGWIYAGDGKMPEYEAEPQKGRPCFLVPQVALSSMDTLPERSEYQPPEQIRCAVCPDGRGIYGVTERREVIGYWPKGKSRIPLCRPHWPRNYDHLGNKIVISQ